MSYYIESFINAIDDAPDLNSGFMRWTEGAGYMWKLWSSRSEIKPHKPGIWGRASFTERYVRLWLRPLRGLRVLLAYEHFRFHRNYEGITTSWARVELDHSGDLRHRISLVWDTWSEFGHIFQSNRGVRANWQRTRPNASFERRYESWHNEYVSKIL